MNFSELVTAAKREAKGEASPDEIALLALPENRGRWIEALRSAIDDAEQQFSYQSGRVERARADATAGLIGADVYAETVAAYESWTKKAARYRIGLQQRLAELAAETDRPDLAAAIARHREVTLAADVAPTAADAELWAALSDDLTAV